MNKIKKKLKKGNRTYDLTLSAAEKIEKQEQTTLKTKKEKSGKEKKDIHESIGFISPLIIQSYIHLQRDMQFRRMKTGIEHLFDSESFKKN